MQTHRLRWALSQHELARLIGKNSHSTISRYEQQGKVPPLRTLLAYEVVFGQGLREMLPALYHEIEDAVLGRGAELWKELEGRDDHGAQRKRDLLLAMVARATGEPSGA